MQTQKLLNQKKRTTYHRKKIIQLMKNANKWIEKKQKALGRAEVKRQSVGVTRGLPGQLRPQLDGVGGGWGRGGLRGRRLVVGGRGC